LRTEAKQKAIAAKKKFEPDEDLTVQAQLMATAITEAATQANRVQSGAERASHQLIQIINDMGLFRMVREEYSTIEEWLADRIPELPPGSGGLSTATYLHNVFIPLVREFGNGFSTKDLLELKENWSKTNAAAPFMRQSSNRIVDLEKDYEKEKEDIEKQINKLSKQIEKTNDLDEKEELGNKKELIEKTQVSLEKKHEKEMKNATKKFKEDFKKVMEVITDPKVPAWGPNNVTQVLKASDNITIFEGDKCYLADGRVVYQIVLPADYERTMESFNKQFCEFHMTDGALMVSALGKLVLANGQESKSKRR
jgi:DNA-binding ferritin-like protein (Dps family)